MLLMRLKMIPHQNAEFTASGNWKVSVYGTGATVEEAADNAIMFGMNF